jgi:hypothetical protein
MKTSTLRSINSWPVNTFLILSGIDIICTTIAVMNPFLRESNPIAGSIGLSSFFLLKIIGSVGVALLFAKRWPVMKALDIGMAGIVIWNIAVMVTFHV